VKKALLSLAVAGLALSAVQASFAAPNAGNFSTANFGAFINVISFPSSGYTPLLEAYRLQGTINTTAQQRGGFTGQAMRTSGAFARNVGYCFNGIQETTIHYPFAFPGNGTLNGVTDLTCLISQYNNIGITGGLQASPELVTAVPGVFALCSNYRQQLGAGTDLRQRLNVNAFAACPGPGYTTPFVQSVRLTKVIPLQPKCPGVFPGATFNQFGANIRTWWALQFTPPGTSFVLDVTVACQGVPSQGNGGKTIISIDRYTWRVEVSIESILAVVDVLHSNPVSTSEIPCIAAEDVYLALRLAVSRIGCATDQFQRQNRLFEAEALVVAFCAFGDCFIAEDFFGTFPPSNDADMAGAFGPTGILDTIENPCCCKLLVDLDNLGGSLGLGLSPGP